MARRLRRPTWRDRRLVVGLLLVLGSTVLGARALAADDGLTPVWVVRHDLAAGTTLETSDLESRAVALPGVVGGYLDASAPAPVGHVLVRDVAARELLPRAAVADPDEAGTHGSSTPRMRMVSVPVDPWRMPADLSRGERVDVYVSDRGVGESPASSHLVAAGAVVAGVEGSGGRFGAGGRSEAVLLTVPADEVVQLVSGMSQGDVDVVRVPGGGA